MNQLDDDVGVLKSGAHDGLDDQPERHDDVDPMVKLKKFRMQPRQFGARRRQDAGRERALAARANRAAPTSHQRGWSVNMVEALLVSGLTATTGIQGHCGAP
ncbi:MAG: hypothetical protein Q8O67_17085 [Deltaproteobacteria bacterium]|nr:hypothetical protein [Deltaproteobacteria bacterium]